MEDAGSFHSNCDQFLQAPSARSWARSGDRIFWPKGHEFRPFVPAEAGTRSNRGRQTKSWIPTSAGMNGQDFNAANSSSSGGRFGSVALQDDVFHHRTDLVLPALAREHAEMANAGLHVMALAVRAQ